MAVVTAMMSIFVHGGPRRLYSEVVQTKLSKFTKIAFPAPLIRSDTDIAARTAQLAHKKSFLKRPLIPKPISPDLTTPEQFLAALGRNLVSHASKFPTWEAFFKATSPGMEKLGIGCRERKYILKWQHNFR